MADKSTKLKILKIEPKYEVTVEIPPIWSKEAQVQRYEVDLKAPWPVRQISGMIEHDEEIVKAIINAVKAFKEGAWVEARITE